MNPKLGSLGLKPSELASVIEEVSGLYDRFRTLGADGFAGAEVGLEATPDEGILLRGSIDAVFEDDSGVRLVDWKTGRLGDPDDQLAFYALVLRAMVRGDLPGRVEAVSVQTGERAESVPSRASIEATMGEVVQAVEQLRRSWDSEGALDRVAGPWCRWCPLLDECSEGRAAVELLRG